MADYMLEAQEEMVAAIAQQDRRRELEEHRQVANDLAAGRRKTAPRELYRSMRARFAGRCDYCGGRIRKGDPILYSSLMPRGHKVICGTCDEGRL